MTDFALS